MQFSVGDVHCDCNETQKWGEVTWRLLMRQQGDPLCERLSLRLVTSWYNFLTSENISSITQIQLSELYTRAVKRKAAASMRRIQTRFTARFHSERTYRNALILIFMLLLICWTVVWFYVLYVFFMLFERCDVIDCEVSCHIKSPTNTQTNNNDKEKTVSATQTVIWINISSSHTFSLTRAGKMFCCSAI